MHLYLSSYPLRRYHVLWIAAVAAFSLFYFHYSQNGNSGQNYISDVNGGDPIMTGSAGSDTSDHTIPQMVPVEGGTFIMGSNTGPEADEKPEHKVNLSSFWIGKYEVTVGEFREFMKSGTYVTNAEKAGFSYSFDGKDLIYQKEATTWEYDVLGKKRVNEEDHPVIHVSQLDALAYCAWLSRKTGRTYRLPTEAEWEYAAKGGIHHDPFLYSGSDNMDRVGWYAWNSDFKTHPVGKKAPNSLGIYDMSGNAWEWCSDKYGPYSSKEQTNPKGADTGSGVVLRGGGWRFYAINTRCVKRRTMAPAFNGSGPGFRIASSQPPR